MGEIFSSGMSKTMPAVLDMSHIGILSIDELIPIFYFLNICNRNTAMRVCKKWHRILCSKQAWSVIDFHEFERQGRWESAGTFMTFEFLKTYAGGSLREIYLSEVSQEIIHYLRENCPNVTTVSHSLLGSRKSFQFKQSADVGSMLFLPPKVRRYELTVGLNKVPMLHFISRLAVTLQYLVIVGFHITTDIADALKALAKKTNLQELQIIEPWYNFRDSPDDILATIGSLKSLKCFRFDTLIDKGKRLTRRFRKGPVLLSNLVLCIGRWQHLKVLALRGVDCSDAAFESMIPGTLNLESLELVGDIVKTSSIVSIGNHLKKLKFLELGNGSYTDESIRSLIHHPELQKLWIHHDFSHQNKLEPVWLRTIYDVLVTFPKLKDVKLEGYRLLFLYSNKHYKDIVGVNLEIQNTYEYPEISDDISYDTLNVRLD